MKKLNVLVMGLLLPMLAAAQTVKSPNGNVVVKFSLSESGQPTYEMSYKGKTVCKPSHLGLELAKDKHASKGMDETSLMDGFTETGSKTSTFDETWKPVWGETATIRNHYNEMEVDLNQASSKRNIISAKIRLLFYMGSFSLIKFSPVIALCKRLHPDAQYFGRNVD